MTRTIELVMRLCLLAICAGFIAVLAYCVAHRISYPFELEWLEGDMLLTAVRVLEQKPIYTPPATDYIPSIYPPFYYVVVAAAFRLFEPSLPVLRGVSVLFLLGIFILIYIIVYRATHTRWLALVSIGLFASFYNHHASWYDIGRVDTVFYCLLLLGLWLAAQTHRPTVAACSSVVLCLALFTKQSTIIYVPFVILFLFLKNWRLSIIFAVIFTLLCASVVLSLQASSDGWFAFYTIINPLSFPKSQSRLSVVLAIIKAFPILWAMAAASFIAFLMPGRQWKDISIWEITLIPSLIAYVRIKPIVGAYANDSIYITLWLSLLVPVWLRRFVSARQHPYRSILGAMAWALLCIQLIDLRYSPLKWLPAPGSASKGEELLARLRSASGPVFVHHHPVYAWLADKEPSMTACNLWAYNLGKRLYTHEDLFAKIRSNFFSVIVLDDNSRALAGYLVAEVENHYVLERTITYKSPPEFSQPVGFRARPHTIWVPK